MPGRGLAGAPSGRERLAVGPRPVNPTTMPMRKGAMARLRRSHRAGPPQAGCQGRSGPGSDRLVRSIFALCGLRPGQTARRVPSRPGEGRKVARVERCGKAKSVGRLNAIVRWAQGAGSLLTWPPRRYYWDEQIASTKPMETSVFRPADLSFDSSAVWPVIACSTSS